jgi:hypothetical protein
LVTNLPSNSLVKKMFITQYAEGLRQLPWMYLFLDSCAGSYLSWQVRRSFRFTQMTQTLIFQTSNLRIWLNLKTFSTCRSNIRMAQWLIKRLSWIVYSIIPNRASTLLILYRNPAQDLILKKSKVVPYMIATIKPKHSCCASTHPITN